MADLKISQLSSATTPLAGTEVFPLVQNSTTKKATINDINAGTYRIVQTVVFTSSGTFTKASYPWLAAIRVKVVGGGGAGAGAAAVATGEASCGSGGGSGAYAESFITDIAGLAASETVTIGAGGTGVAGAGGNAGSSSSFGSAVVATGGQQGFTTIAAGSTVFIARDAGGGGAKSGCTGNFTAGGNGGTYGMRTAATVCQGGSSGGSVFGGGRQATGTNSAGLPGDAPGAGGSGAAHVYAGSDLAAKAGGNGADGIVIVELFA